MRNEAQRQIDAYNKRIRRAQEKGYGIGIAPLSIKGVELVYTTKKDVKKLLDTISKAVSSTLTSQEYERSLAKTNEASRNYLLYGVVESKSNAGNLLLDIASSMAVPDDIGKFPTERGRLNKQIGLVEGQGEENLEAISKWITGNEARANLWYDNYFKAIDNAKDMYYGDDEANRLLDEIAHIVRGLNLQEYTVGQLAFGERLAITYIYPTEGDDSYIENLVGIRDIWETISNG